MKRILALTVAMLVLVTIIVPVQGFAAGDDKGLEKAIKAVRSIIEVPEDYKLESRYGRRRGDKNVWDLSWRSKDDQDGSISASITEDDVLLWYDRYKPEYYQEEQRKLPKVSRGEAKIIAEQFINKVNPSILSNVKYNESIQNSLMDYAYSFSYTRVENNVPYNNNTVNVSVNRNTGDVTYYNYNWTDGLEFPDTSNVISIEEAEKAYGEKMGLKLIYQFSRAKDETKIFPVYVPKYDNYTYGIDAVTGEKINLGSHYGPYYNNEVQYSRDMAMKEAAGGMGGGIVLTPEEEKEVQEISSLISLEEAEKIARDSSAIGLDNENLSLEDYNLSRDWANKDEIVWSLNFRNNPSAENSTDNKEVYIYRHASVRINAKTGEIKSFYISTPYNEGDKAKDDQEAAKAAVEKFLKEFKPDKFELVELDEEQRDRIIILEDSELPRTYWFRFNRKVNGIPFPGNGFSITYDAVNQKVMDFNMDWYDIIFPSVAGAISIETANEALFEKVGLELQYKEVYPKDIKEVDYANVKPEMKLVYVVKSGKPLNLDAYTGNIVNYDGTPYKEYKIAEYTDVAGHYAEKQINILAEYGISLEGTEFKPNQQIKQKEFFTLLVKTMNQYYAPILRDNSTEEELKKMYDYLIREKIITADEKNPEAVVKREDSIKYIIRSLKYNEVAEIEGIYNCPFKDVDEIDPDLIGYVTIASGLKIVNGYNGNINPKGEMTRAEAAVMIFNYLSR